MIYGTNIIAVLLIFTVQFFVIFTRLITMQLIIDIIQSLSNTELADLKKEVAVKNSLPYQILQEYVHTNGKALEKEIITKFNTSKTTFNKSCTQSKEILIDLLAKQIRTDFDIIILVRRFLYTGLYSTAEKLITDLEKEYEQKQQWQLLELLYIESYRLCHITGNAKKLESFSVKRNSNSVRLQSYITLSGSILRELICLEGFKLKPSVNNYFSTLVQLGKQTEKLNHYTLNLNSLTLQNLYLSRFTNQTKELAIVNQQIENLYKHKSQYLQFNTKLIAINTHINYLSQLVTPTNPNILAKKTLVELNTLGVFVASNLCYALCEYNLYTMQFKDLNFWLSKLENYKDESKFTLFYNCIKAIKHFVNDQWQEFKKEVAVFYSKSDNQNFPDMEVVLRLLELLLIKKQKDLELLEYKAEALRLFMTRNLSKERYTYEWAILNYFKKKNAKSQDVFDLINVIDKSAYYNILFLKQLILQHLKEF